MKQIKIKHWIGQTVYFRTDEEQLPHLVTGIIIRNTGIMIEVSRNGFESTVNDFEIIEKEDMLVKMGIN